jgi:hypothetical protein
LRVNNVIEPHKCELNLPACIHDASLRRSIILAYIDAGYLGQMVDGCLKVDGFGFQVFKVSNDNHSVSLTTSELAALIHEGVEIKRKMTLNQTLHSNAKAEKLLGFGPQKDCRDYLKSKFLHLKGFRSYLRAQRDQNYALDTPFLAATKSTR